MSLEVSPGEILFGKVKEDLINTLSVSKKSLNFFSANCSERAIILNLILSLQVYSLAAKSLNCSSVKSSKIRLMYFSISLSGIGNIFPTKSIRRLVKFFTRLSFREGSRIYAMILSFTSPSSLTNVGVCSCLLSSKSTL